MIRLYSTSYAALVCDMTVAGITLWVRQGKVPSTEVLGLPSRVFTLPQLIGVLDYAVEQAPIRWGSKCEPRRSRIVQSRKGFAEMLHANV